ncbi:MAG: 8-oxo-dGTP diphosphatase [Caldilineaceae bacterium]
MIDTTICLPMLGKPPNQVLLALKKRGFGMGKITGVGGKIEAGETAAHSAIRELVEEIGITVALADLQERGVIDFLFPFKPSWNMRSYLFVVEAWQGSPSESDEVAPHFYPFDQIPFERMWADARHWLPPLLQNQSIRARFVFGEDNETITGWNVE